VRLSARGILLRRSTQSLRHREAAGKTEHALSECLSKVSNSPRPKGQETSTDPGVPLVARATALGTKSAHRSRRFRKILGFSFRTESDAS
jgi:hypothetical protein